MGKKLCWVIIVLTIAVNVVSLHFTIESYYGKHYEHVYLFTGIACVSIIVAIITFFRWKKLEYAE
ncbi:hypothetical protein ACWE42_22125 [Sutcliffiella cohnii]|uniref:Uncharacterized protein n=1 Tax=Sutcliffiella cohnii TaxID=33932 RepID=A0A223KLM7_9BACI|nr:MULTISPECIES: hypothetical protein [Sutcliffiella]AST90409.1 hypothetical protein BC6307_03540 [Sutcliffiella cohnii]MED4017475.1 hypothetical protein [Sutcliffiella cohnii]WBL16064.1 hypothetical protein O1A01_05360 [Sutcliffiella sp. NC1]